MKNYFAFLTGKQRHQTEEAALILKAGGIVAFPTETVYGLGADATNVKAIRRVYEAKQRPLNHPVIVHVGYIEQLSDWAKEINLLGKQLIEHFWPGPLTLILPRASRVPDEVTGGQDTVAIRMPSNDIALALLQALERPIVAPSANSFGKTSPTHSDHVRQDLGSAVDFIIEGGYCAVGIESTILDISGKEPKILRLGAITPGQIEKAIGMKLLTPGNSSIRVPGNLASHYAPSSPLIVVPAIQFKEEVLLLARKGKKIAVLSQQSSFLEQDQVFWFQMPSSPEAYIKDFYRYLFMADQQQPSVILIEELPAEDAWLAIRDRMVRAQIAVERR